MQTQTDNIKIINMFPIDRQDGQPDDIMLICNDNTNHGYYNLVVRNKSKAWHKLQQSKNKYLNCPLIGTYIFDYDQYRNAAILIDLEEIPPKISRPYYFISTDGYSISTELLPSQKDAIKKMKYEYDSCWSQYPSEEDNSMADQCYISEENGEAIFYDNGYNVYVYKIIPAYKEQPNGKDY